MHVVHHTAAKEGYGGIEYRERLAGLSSGAASLYGLIPTLLGAGASVVLCALMVLPYSSSAALKMRDWINTPLQKRVRDLAFDGFQSTGKTFVHGFGASQSGRSRVSVKLHSNYDAGLGFTMLCACTVAAESARRVGTPQAAKPGFRSAVVALGGNSLAAALQSRGVTLDVSVVQANNSKL